MPINQVVVDPTDTWTAIGRHEYDRDLGGILIVPHGNVFPASPEADELFWRDDESRLYKRDSSNTSWSLVVASPGAHAASHQDGGSDEINVGGLSGVLADRQDADKLQGHNVSGTAPSTGQVLTWDGSAWAPTTPTPSEHSEVCTLNQSTSGQIIGDWPAQVVQFDDEVTNSDSAVVTLWLK